MHLQGRTQWHGEEGRPQTAPISPELCPTLERGGARGACEHGVVASLGTWARLPRRRAATPPPRGRCASPQVCAHARGRDTYHRAGPATAGGGAEGPRQQGALVMQAPPSSDSDPESEPSDSESEASNVAMTSSTEKSSASGLVT